jgi:hypothetical protein
MYALDLSFLFILTNWLVENRDSVPHPQELSNIKNSALKSLAGKAKIILIQHTYVHAWNLLITADTHHPVMRSAEMV